MRVAVVLEQRFSRTPDGSVWTSSAFDREFWNAYLAVFDSVRVVARVLDVGAPETGWRQSSGRGVIFDPIPHYIGATQFIRKFPTIRRALRAAAQPADAYVFRVPSPAAALMSSVLRERGHPYALEVVGDPVDVFAPGAVSHPLRPLVRWWATRTLRRAAAGAVAASYVTDEALQRRYPCQRFMVGISSIRLGEDAFAAGPRIYRKSGKAIVFVGTLEELYKAPDILIQAVADLVGGGEDLTLTIVGDGRRRFDLERSGAAQALGDRLRFAGALPPGSAVRQELDRADLFVLPSRQEGLPRAMIEAMARGLPAIGSTVGGIPELLSPSELVPPGDVGALRAVIKDLISDPDRMTRLSSRNWDAARRYASTRLMPLRVGFYVRLKEATSRLTATQK